MARLSEAERKYMRHVENSLYFDWLYNSVCRGRFHENVSYRKLLKKLHSIEFRYLLSRDGNWAVDGVALRYEFLGPNSELITGPCSVLEMMVEVARYCEEHIMDDPAIGDRTGQWFWGMIVNLGLGSMDDSRFDPDYVDDVIERFLDRDYEPDGRGGLFTIRNCEYDLREVDIFRQLCWYLNSIT